MPAVSFFVWDGKDKKVKTEQIPHPHPQETRLGSG
jgi:hypothetical protein